MNGAHLKRLIGTEAFPLAITIGVPSDDMARIFSITGRTSQHFLLVWFLFVPSTMDLRGKRKAFGAQLGSILVSALRKRALNPFGKHSTEKLLYHYKSGTKF